MVIKLILFVLSFAIPRLFFRTIFFRTNAISRLETMKKRKGEIMITIISRSREVVRIRIGKRNPQVDYI